MVILANDDMFSVRLASLIANYDYETLANLYQPLVGHTSLSLYFTFLAEASFQKVNSLSSHESFLAKMQMNTGDFLKARKALEAIGLLRTYVENNNGAKIYSYVLFAPKTPDEFFSDTLLYGLLISYIGEVDAKRLNKYYASTSISNRGEEITASFKDVFRPNFESKAFIKALKSEPGQGRNRARMKLEFSFDSFFSYLKNISQISEKAFTKEELNEILRLSSLYGIDEEFAAQTISNFYDPNLDKGKRIDFKGVTKAFQEETNYSYLSSFKGRNGQGKSSPNIVSSKGDLAAKINMMETISPKEYLTILQNGTEPALPDLKLIDYLSKKFKLKNCVLNLVIDYTLQKNNNILSKPYMEKVCASLVRSGIETTVDAMNYLVSISKDKKTYENKEIKEESKKENKRGNDNAKNKEEDDAEWDALMAELEDMGEGGEDGKA